jgi:hypothetical protein
LLLRVFYLRRRLLREIKSRSISALARRGHSSARVEHLEAIRPCIHPSDRPTDRQDNATLPCAHQGLKDANVDPFFIQQRRAEKKIFLNGARVREQCSFDGGSQCECKSVCKYKFERRAAGGELLFARVIAPCCCCAGDELYYYVRLLLQREMRKFDARRILTQFGFCLAARQNHFTFVQVNLLLLLLGDSSLLWDLFLFSHAAPAQTNGRVNCLNEIIKFYLFFAIFAACVQRPQRFFRKLKFLMHNYIHNLQTQKRESCLWLNGMSERMC